MSASYTTPRSIQRSTMLSSSAARPLSSPLDYKTARIDDGDSTDSTDSEASNTPSPEPESRPKSPSPPSTPIITPQPDEEAIDSAVELLRTPKRITPSPEQYKVTKASPSYLRYDDNMNLNRNWRGRMKHAGHKDPKQYREALLKTLRKFWEAGYESSEEWKKLNLATGEE